MPPNVSARFPTIAPKIRPIMIPVVTIVHVQRPITAATRTIFTSIKARRLHGHRVGYRRQSVRAIDLSFFAGSFFSSSEPHETIVYHVNPNLGAKEGPPVVDTSIYREGPSEKPAERGSSIPHTEDESDTDSFPETGFDHAGTFTQGGGERVGGHGHTEHKNGNGIHGGSTVGTKQTSHPCARPAKHERLAGLAKPHGCLHHSLTG